MFKDEVSPNLGMISPESLEGIKKRYLEATWGTWFWTETQNVAGEPVVVIFAVTQPGHMSNLKTVAVLDKDDRQNAEFITNARNDIFWMLAEIEHLKGLVNLVIPKMTKPNEQVS